MRFPSTFQDPSNLQGKVQKHQAFEAELSANQSRIDALEQAGQKLIDVKHYASEEVAARMNEVISLWKKLLEATELKGKGRVSLARKEDAEESLCRKGKGSRL